MSASVLKGQPVDPRGLRDPQTVNKIQVEKVRELNEPNTAGTSGHAAPPVWVEKQPIISAGTRVMWAQNVRCLV